MTHDSYKNCEACGSEIPSGANLCSVCHSYQAGWKNHVRYLANVIGILSVVVGVIVFSISLAPEIRKTLNWHDEVQILSFGSTKPISIANLGDGEVFVSHIQITSSEPDFNLAERVDQPIAPGKTVTVERDEDTFAHIGSYVVGASDNPKEREYLLSRATRPQLRACVLRVVAVPTDPGYLTYVKSHGDKLITYEVESTIHYFSLKTKVWITEDAPLIGYLLVDDDEQRCPRRPQ